MNCESQKVRHQKVKEQFAVLVLEVFRNYGFNLRNCRKQLVDERRVGHGHAPSMPRSNVLNSA
jgi:hypothetical protein